MALTEQDILHLTRLAGLQADPTELPAIQSDFTRILGLIQTLQSVDTHGVEPMAHPLQARQDVTLRLDADQAQPPLTEAERDRQLANAPATHNGLFLVPTVLE